MSIKYHAVTLTAVLFALAAGIALGAGVLGGESDSSTESRPDAPASSGELASFEAGFADRTAPALVDSVLEGSSVLVIEVPGATREGTDAVIESLQNADATIAGNIAVTERLIDPAERQFADGVATNSLDEVDDVEVAENSYGRVGAALARALVDEDGAELDGDANAIVAAFTSGDLLEVRGEIDQRADAVVFVGGAEIPDTGQASVVAEIAAVLDETATGVVVAGPSIQSAEGGLVTAVAESEASMAVSTFDVLDSPLGMAALPLVLAAEIDGTSGAYGTARAAGGPLPDPS